MVLHRRQRESGLADNLRPAMQRRLGRRPLVECQPRPHCLCFEHDLSPSHKRTSFVNAKFRRPPTRRSSIMRTTLPTRQLGTTDLNITRVGFGAWAVGGGGWAFGWGPQDDNESIAAMNHALDLGVNWIDTAGVYGRGHSEEIVGRLLKQRKGADRPYIFTKCGLVWNPKDPMEDAKRILSP